jgi:hypothetical protein
MGSAQLRMYEPGQEASADGIIQLRVENVVSTPVVSSSYLGPGGAIAGEYLLEFTKTGSTFTVDVTGSDPKNPWTRDAVAITADDATENVDVIPGISFVFSSSIVTGWTAKATLFAYMDGSAVVTDRFNHGIILAGDASTEFQTSVKNVGTEDSADSVVYILPGCYIDDEDDYQWFATITNHSSTSRHKMALAGDYVISFADWKDGTGDHAGYKTADVLVDGVKTIEDAVFDGVTAYEYGDGIGYIDAADKFKGLRIILANTTDDPSSATPTLKVSDAWAWVTVAPDSSGVSGTYTTDLVITEAGETTGTITAGNYTKVWFLVEVPSDKSPGDIRVYRVRLSGKSI